MTAAEIACLLIEQEGLKVDPKVTVLINRILLQIGSEPALQTHLIRPNVVDVGNGTVQLEFEFTALPEQVIPQVEMLIGADAEEFRDSKKWSAYVKDGHNCYTLSLRVNPKDLPGNARTVAF